MASMMDTSNNTVRQNAADGGGSSDNNNKTLCDEEDDGSDKIMTILNKTRELSSLSDRQEYEKRVLTFQASTYYAKPACLSPLFCARFGWKNADIDMLVCSSCSSALAINITSKLSTNSYEKLCSAYRDRIVSNHDSKCPFRLSTEQFHYLENVEDEENKNVDTSTTTENNENTKTSLQKSSLIIPVSMGRVLPEETMRLMEHPTPSSIIRQHAKKLSDVTITITEAETTSSSPSWRYPRLHIPTQIQQMYSSTTELTKFLGCDDESILTLSLLGWQKVDVNDSDRVVTMGCPLCLSIMELQLERQRMENGICVVVADEEDGNDVMSATGPSPKKRQKKSARYLNPLDAHRHYCPVKVGFPKTSTEDKNPVWKIILERINKEYQCRKINSTAIQETSSDVVADEVLDESITNVRRILRTGIALASYFK